MRLTDWEAHMDRPKREDGRTRWVLLVLVCYVALILYLVLGR